MTESQSHKYTSEAVETVDTTGEIDKTVENADEAVETIDDARQRRYTRWKKNSKLLYEFLNTNNTKWPSLTCQLFPDLDLAGDTHRILLSSFTSSQLPEDESLYVGKLSSMKHLSWSSLNNFDMEEREFKIDNSLKLPPKNLVEDLRIKFPAGDCNKARLNVSNPDIIAAASSNGSVYVFDKTKHGSARQKLISGAMGDPDYQIHCQLTTSVTCAENEAISLAWNWQRQGSLATTYAGGQVCVWDLQKFHKTSPTLVDPQFNIIMDPQGTNDVSWMVNHDSLLACCGEGNVLRVLDTRIDQQKAASQAVPNKHHSNGINVCQFNYHKDLLLCSADSSGKINSWDIRNFEEPVQSWQHCDAVSALQWNPHHATVLATASQNDGLVKLWDLSQPDDEQLVFTHGGHMLGVNDISWDLHDPWMMCTVSNDNSVQLWRPASHLLAAVGG
ncbi:LAME_0H07668g1_1 [Lachancea meyersii CBS 8951]|uniref:LAME_0H07668g1_1 n=1 Tax=Lachancea meyersii CBS 8951 TaxID=1266667 RepID=A0A1G4KEX6_9SACH|nr:LAME_0H07668g1_1 [Lachancea meyersii CBS 8951]